jgi:hypothetical protein
MDTLREMYQTHQIDEICEAMGRSRRQLYEKARFLKLKRPTDWRAKHCPFPRDTSHQFQKGHTTWNKGKKGISIGGVATQFKKGDVPHNKLPDDLRELTKTLSRLKKNINQREKRNAER